MSNPINIAGASSSSPHRRESPQDSEDIQPPYESLIQLQQIHRQQLMSLQHSQRQEVERSMKMSANEARTSPAHSSSSQRGDSTGTCTSSSSSTSPDPFEAHSPSIRMQYTQQSWKQYNKAIASIEGFDPDASVPRLTTSPSAQDGGYNIRIVSGSSNRKLALDIGKALDIQLQDAEMGSFCDGECKIQINNNVRGADVYVIQPTCPPDVNRAVMELLLTIHTLRLSSAKRITAVVPYFGYARQDRKMKPRVPISASAVAQLIEAMGPNRVVTVDLHCGQIQGFFHKTPVDNLHGETEFMEYLVHKNFDLENLVIVSPDAGGVARARSVADRIHAQSVCTIIKRRTQANQVDSMQIVGNVEGRTCVIVDDMIDTAGTLTKAAELLKANGATKVYACATHGVFSAPALQRITDSILEEVVVTDSIPQEENRKACPKLKVLSLVNLLAQAIRRLHEERSLNVLFQKRVKEACGSQ
eukprot:TRINITY_DN7277_c0_g1_i1.p1 TRINITY_DN7277_c0_g1~~TRINITY_DN7277_c0_g1_i1.p1  ORF type:complete len:499 (+),score=103.34 TRINITY_DN7277_c0_g1_i1:79-1497(+)